MTVDFQKRLYFVSPNRGKADKTTKVTYVGEVPERGRFKRVCLVGAKNTPHYVDDNGMEQLKPGRGKLADYYVVANTPNVKQPAAEEAPAKGQPKAALTVDLSPLHEKLDAIALRLTELADAVDEVKNSEKLEAKRAAMAKAREALAAKRASADTAPSQTSVEAAVATVVRRDAATHEEKTLEKIEGEALRVSVLRLMANACVKVVRVGNTRPYYRQTNTLPGTIRFVEDKMGLLVADGYDNTRVFELLVSPNNGRKDEAISVLKHFPKEAT